MILTGPEQLAVGLVLFFDFDAIPAACCSAPNHKASGGHYAVCLEIRHKGNTSWWTPAFSDAGGKHVALPPGEKQGLPEWTNVPSHLYCNQVFALRFATVQALAADRDTSGGENRVLRAGLARISSCCSKGQGCIPTTQATRPITRWGGLAKAKALKPG